MKNLVPDVDIFVIKFVASIAVPGVGLKKYEVGVAEWLGLTYGRPDDTVTLDVDFKLPVKGGLKVKLKLAADDTKGNANVK